MTKSQKSVKTYHITIPAYTQEIQAESRAEALEMFDWHLDNAQCCPEFWRPIVEEVTSNAHAYASCEYAVL